ncbi:MAG: IS66 family transposase [Sedimentisphaerales bacterium]|nr:IS66 family transposase [Sedimentisphaerales bacterium]
MARDRAGQSEFEKIIDAHTSAEQLPSDTALLRQMVLTLLSNVNSLQRELAQYQRYLFGRRSEKLDPQQPTLFDLPEPAVAESETVSEAPVPERSGKSSHRNGRVPLPAHLPRDRKEYHPPAEALVCSRCGQAKVPMGEEITEQLDYLPASFIVRQHVRIKYACKQCQDGVVIADLPARPIEKGRPGEGLLAHVLTSKYCDHLPLHRMEGIFQRHGLQIARSTLCDWVGDGATLLTPLVKEMHRQILLSPKIHTDDTPVPARNGAGKEIHKGYLWAYIDIANNVVFDYTPGHSRAGPVQFLGDYAGYLQADAYQGYDAIFEKGWATEVACWAHARRKFFEAQNSDPARAVEMLVLIKDLYEIEQRARDDELQRDQIQALRQQESKPILTTIEKRLELWATQVLPKSPIGQAISYARGQWQALNRYTDDGILSIDNNLAERVLRMVAIGRKNWLFVGHDNGGHRAAIIYSLVASCKLCGLDPFAYLRDALERINTHPANRVAELLPANWQSARS